MLYSKLLASIFTGLVVILASSACFGKIPVPEYLGVFGLSGDELLELDYLEFSDDSTVVEWNAVKLDNTDDLKIIVYGDYAPSSISIFKVSSSMKDKRLRIEEKIRVRIKPQSGLQGLIGSLLLVESRKPLIDGHYIVYIKSSDESWCVTVGNADPFYASDPTFSVAEVGSRVIAGCSSGLMVFDNGKVDFIQIEGTEEDLKELESNVQLDKLRFVNPSQNDRADAGEYVLALSASFGVCHFYFNLKTMKGFATSLQNIRNGWIDATIVHYYDILIPSLTPDIPWFGSSGCNKDDGLEEKYGMISIPKGQSWIKLTVNDIKKSKYDTIEKEDRVYCFSEATPEVILIGTDKYIYRTEYNSDKKKFDHRKLDKIKEGPLGIVYMSPGVNGVVYAINGEQKVFKTTDTGITWAECTTITSADKIIVSAKNTQHVIYGLEGKYFLSKDDCAIFLELKVKSAPIYDCCFSNAVDDLLYVATEKGAFKSSDLGETWSSLATF